MLLVVQASRDLSTSCCKLSYPTISRYLSHMQLVLSINLWTLRKDIIKMSSNTFFVLWINTWKRSFYIRLKVIRTLGVNSVMQSQVQSQTDSKSVAMVHLCKWELVTGKNMQQSMMGLVEWCSFALFYKRYALPNLCLHVSTGTIQYFMREQSIFNYKYIVIFCIFICFGN